MHWMHFEFAAPTALNEIKLISRDKFFKSWKIRNEIYIKGFTDKEWERYAL